MNFSPRTALPRGKHPISSVSPAAGELLESWGCHLGFIDEALKIMWTLFLADKLITPQ